MAENLQVMKPRDIVTPSATILGLIVTAIGILVALAGESKQSIVRNFAFLFIIVVILFVSAVISTSLSTLLRRVRFWNFALVFYIAGWSVLGSVLIIVMIGYAYGVDMLQVQMPQFSLEFFTSVSSIVAVAASAIVMWFQYKRASEYRRKLAEMSKKVDVTKKEFDKVTDELKSESTDLTNSLVILRSDIERELRKLVRESKTQVERHYPYPIRRLVTALKQREVISPQLAYSVLFVYNFCSKAVHGEVVSQKDALLIRELGIKTLISLRNLVAKYEKQ